MNVIETTSNEHGKALLDTGAQVDCLDQTFVKRMGKLDQIERFEHTKFATSFNGKRTEILGVLNVTLKIAGKNYKNINWYVLDLDGKFNAILGTPFFDKHGLTRSMNEQIALIFGEKPSSEENF